MKKIKTSFESAFSKVVAGEEVNVEQEIATFNEAVNEVQADFDSKISALEAKVTEMESKVSDLESSIESKDAEISELTAQNEDLGTRLKSEKEGLVSASADLKTANAKVVDLEAINAKLSKDTEQLRADIQSTANGDGAEIKNGKDLWDQAKKQHATRDN